MAGVSGRGQQQGERADHNDCQREGYDSGAVPGRGLNNRKSDRTERRASGTVGAADRRTAGGSGADKQRLMGADLRGAVG